MQFMLLSSASSIPKTFKAILKRVSITGFPVIENLIADSDIKDRTERSPQAANKVVSRKFQTFVF